MAGPDSITLSVKASDLAEGMYIWTASPGAQHLLRCVRRELQSNACQTTCLPTLLCRGWRWQLRGWQQLSPDCPASDHAPCAGAPPSN